MRTLYPLLLLLLTGRMLLAQCITYTYDSMGNRTARVIAGGCNTDCDFAVAASTSNANPAANASITLSASCSGSACGGVSYQWSGNGLSQGGQSVTLNAPGASGSHTYTVTASRSGCSNKTATVTVTVGSPPGSCGTGTGLAATYFSGTTLGGSPIATLTQGPIDFSGGDGQHVGNSGVAGSNISARWEGQVEAPATGSYTFNMRTDDGVRVWFNNTQVVDDFGDYAPTDHNFTVSLTAGQKYNIRMEWKQGGGGYEARLFWTHPGQATQIVPACRLYPTGGGGNCTPATGYATLRRWTGVTGSTLADLSSQTSGYTSSPSSTTSLSELRTQTDWGDNYGQQVQGYITAPLSGSYTFWIASDDNSELWLSSGESPSSMQRIAWVESWTNPEVWNQFPSQKSAPVSLTACQRYYFEIRHKEGGGGDNLAVGWAKPGEGTSSPSGIVPGSVLSPYSSNCTPPAAPVLSASQPSIVSGQSSTLSATGCAGTVTWSNGLGTGTSKSVSPTATTTYTATCTVNGCTSGNGSVTVSVGPGGGNCAAGNFGGSFDGANCGHFNGWAIDFNDYGRTVDVEIYVDGTLVATVAANQSRPDLVTAFGTPQAEYHGWFYPVPENAPWRTGSNRTVTVRACGATADLPGGPKTVNCTGGTPCTPPAAPVLTASQPSISSGQSSTLSATGCAGTVTWSNGLGTGTSKTVSPTATTTYTATCTVSGCTSANGSVTVTVGPGGGNCAAGNFGGSFDGANCGHFNGWAIDFNDYGRTVDVEIYVDGTLVATVAANQSRPDLVTAFGTPQAEYHGWFYPVPENAPWRTGSNRTVTVRACGATADLPGGPKTVNCTGGAPCTPPAAPTLTASQPSIVSGQSSTLSATGCAGTVTWSNGLGTGISKSVSPTATTTYTATCTVNGCTSGNASVTVTVNQPPNNVCINLGDQCSGNSAEIRSYTLNLSSGGSRALTLTYRSHEGNGTGRIRINGGGWQTFPLNQTPGDLSYLTLGIGSYSLASGSNTIELSSGSGFLCFRELCAGNSGTRIGIAEAFPEENQELMVSPNPNNGQFEASFYVEPGFRASLSVSDMQGREVWHKVLQGEGQHREPVRLPGDSTGMYIVSLMKERLPSGHGHSNSIKMEHKKVIVVK